MVNINIILASVEGENIMDKLDNKKSDIIKGYRAAIILLMLILIAVSNHNTKWKETVDDHITELREEIYQKDWEIEELQDELERLKRDHDDLESMVWYTIHSLEEN